MWRRKPRITEDIYAKLMTSFGRVVDLDPLVSGPATALAERIANVASATIMAIDEREYPGAAIYHLRLLAGAWVMAHDGNVPRATVEVFEEAVSWRFARAGKAASRLPRALSERARGERAGRQDSV